jgi:phosphoribosylanthranilate isomerase
MNKVKLKICGITSVKDARAAVECGAEYLGFNFYSKSPRYIAPAAAREIIGQMPAEIISAGIFVNVPTPEEVRDVLAACGAQLAQLHGDESPDYCRAVGPDRVIKALRAGNDFDVNSVTEYPASAILLDAFDKHLYGGTGKTANWDLAREAARRVRLFLAGGLSPDNVAEAIRAVEPFAVDVNSGVETAPGEKDHAKLQRLKAALIQ